MTKILVIKNCNQCPDSCWNINKRKCRKKNKELKIEALTIIPKWCPLLDKPAPTTGKWLQEQSNKIMTIEYDQRESWFWAALAECINNRKEVDDD